MLITCLGKKEVSPGGEKNVLKKVHRSLSTVGILSDFFLHMEHGEFEMRQ